MHVFGPLDLTQRLLPELRKNQGRIVNISSITSTVIIPTGSVYGSSKLGACVIDNSHMLAGVPNHNGPIRPVHCVF